MERTLILVKPDAVIRGLTGGIINRLEEQGLKLVALKMLLIDNDLARKHYAQHQGKPFFEGLLAYICSAPVVASVFEAEGAIQLARKIMGDTDPAKAEKGTIRGDWGLDIEHNSVHGSDSPETSRREIELYFGDDEITD
jgi:nucleoside-diphosphate kinase